MTRWAVNPSLHIKVIKKIDLIEKSDTFCLKAHKHDLKTEPHAKKLKTQFSAHDSNLRFSSSSKSQANISCGNKWVRGLAGSDQPAQILLSA